VPWVSSERKKEECQEKKGTDHRKKRSQRKKLRKKSPKRPKMVTGGRVLKKRGAECGQNTRQIGKEVRGRHLVRRKEEKERNVLALARKRQHSTKKQLYPKLSPKGAMGGRRGAKSLGRRPTAMKNSPVSYNPSGRRESNRPQKRKSPLQGFSVKERLTAHLQQKNEGKECRTHE